MTATVAHGEWSKLLDILKKNRIIQDPKLCECYDPPLLEWTYQQNTAQKSNSSTTNDYSKKFRDMLEYHVQNFYNGHTHAKLVKHDIVKTAVNCFLYEEHVSLGGLSHKFELAGAVSLTLGDWVVQGFKDGQMTSNQRGTKGFEEMFDYLRDSHLLVLPNKGTKEYKALVENFKEKYEMKLHEEFREYENMWEATDRRKIRQHFYKTKNGKKYDLLDEKDFRAYIEDAPPEARPHTIMWVRSAVVHECDGDVRFPEEARKMADRVARELSAKYYDKPLT